MKIFADVNRAVSSIEVLLSYRELKDLTDSLVEFKGRVGQYIKDNQEKKQLGFTHIHFQDNHEKRAVSKSDIVFYVDMNDE